MLTPCIGMVINFDAGACATNLWLFAHSVSRSMHTIFWPASRFPRLKNAENGEWAELMQNVINSSCAVSDEAQSRGIKRQANLE